MARPRAIDYDQLRDMVRQHPEWSNEDYAKAMDAKLGTVDAAITRNKSKWGLPERRVRMHYAAFMPPYGTLADRESNGTVMRYLRELAKESSGELPADDDDNGVKVRRQALRFFERHREAGEILDLSTKGVPFMRRALPGEVDGDGKPMAPAAWMLPGWRQE